MQPFEWVSKRLDDWRRNLPWPSEEKRERSITKMVSPLYAMANRDLTSAEISRYMRETAGLSTYETGRKLAALTDAEFSGPVKRTD